MKISKNTKIIIKKTFKFQINITLVINEIDFSYYLENYIVRFLKFISMTFEMDRILSDDYYKSCIEGYKLRIANKTTV